MRFLLFSFSWVYLGCTSFWLCCFCSSPVCFFGYSVKVLFKPRESCSISSKWLGSRLIQSYLEGCFVWQMCPLDWEDVPIDLLWFILGFVSCIVPPGQLPGASQKGGRYDVTNCWATNKAGHSALFFLHYKHRKLKPIQFFECSKCFRCSKFFISSFKPSCPSSLDRRMLHLNSCKLDTSYSLSWELTY